MVKKIEEELIERIDNLRENVIRQVDFTYLYYLSKAITDKLEELKNRRPWARKD